MTQSYRHLKHVRFVLVALMALFVFASAGRDALAELEVDINRGVIEPLPIAITPFYEVDRQQGNSFSKDIPDVVSNDLSGSGLFRTVNPKAFIQSVESLSKEGPNFGEWRATGAQALVTGNVLTTDDGRTRVEFYLWDVLSQQKLAGMAYTTNPNNWRRISHIIADQIYSRLTGEDGYFDSRIVYVAENGPADKRVKRLAIMDQDGANHKYLTNGDSLVLTPRFSPTRQQITYMSYDRGRPTVYLYNLSNGDHKPLGTFPGMTFAPRFSPDGNSVIMSLAKNGNTDIYEMRLNSNSPKRITTNSAIETSPSFSPDGKKIVFESDRGGTQQLYTMDRDGDNLERITFGKGRYANPVWSPRGDLIAFTRMAHGKFYIGVIRPDGSGERLITSSRHVEGPTWSPNGRVLSYFKEVPVGAGGRSRQVRIYTVDITGYNEKVLDTPVDGSDPAWSPRNEL